MEARVPGRNSRSTPERDARVLPHAPASPHCSRNQLKSGHRHDPSPAEDELRRHQRTGYPGPMSEPDGRGRFLTKRHLLLWGIINGEGIPTGKHTSTLYLFSRVVNCSTGILCTQSVVHYT